MREAGGGGGARRDSARAPAPVAAARPAAVPAALLGAVGAAGGLGLRVERGDRRVADQVQAALVGDRWAEGTLAAPECLLAVTSPHAVGHPPVQGREVNVVADHGGRTGDRALRPLRPPDLP